MSMPLHIAHLSPFRPDNAVSLMFLSRDTLRIIALYLFWLSAHFFASQYYPKLCTPYDLHGFFMSPLLAPTAHCSAMRWMINHGGNTICGGWLFLGSLCLDLLTIKHRV